MVRAGIALMALGAALVGVGCYGSTEPASNVNLRGATLNGSGTADDGAADVFFQYWPSAYPSRRRETTHVTVPDGATGPFSQHAPWLALDTEYSFRLCGADEGESVVCAQTRTFRMPTPAGDAVVGSVPRAFGFRPMHVEAQSRPTGASPQGTLAVLGAFGGSVTSMQVVGRRAGVLAKGTAHLGTDSFPATACATIADAGPDSPPDTGDYASVEISLTGISPPLGACVPPQEGFTGDQDGVSVYDAVTSAQRRP